MTGVSMKNPDFEPPKEEVEVVFGCGRLAKLLMDQHRGEWLHRLGEPLA